MNDSVEVEFNLNFIIIQSSGMETFLHKFSSFIGLVIMIFWKWQVSSKLPSTIFTCQDTAESFFFHKDLPSLPIRRSLHPLNWAQILFWVYFQPHFIPTPMPFWKQLYQQLELTLQPLLWLTGQVPSAAVSTKQIKTVQWKCGILDPNSSSVSDLP